MPDPHVAPTWAELVAPIILALATLVGAIAAAWANLRKKIEQSVVAAEVRQGEIKVSLDGRLTALIEALKEKGAVDVKLATMEGHQAGLAQATSAEVQARSPLPSTPARSTSTGDATAKGPDSEQSQQ